MNTPSPHGLNRDMIKYIAISAMLISHIGAVFLDPYSILAELCHDIGQFTAITMCYFLVEGYGYTHSKVKYALRLLLFGVISQIPYWYALEIYQLNIFFTLLICFLILVVMDKLKLPLINWVVILLLVWLSIRCDWAVLAPIFTILFAKLNTSKLSLIFAYTLSFFVSFLADISLYAVDYEYPLPRAIFSSFLSGIALIASGFVIIYFYNGKKSERNIKINKWFFYIFYPGHLALLWLLKILLGIPSHAFFLFF